MLLPFEAVTISSGLLDIDAQAIRMSLGQGPFQGAPTVPEDLKLTPTDWEPGVRTYWNQYVRLSNLTTECLVPDGTGNLVPVYKTVYARDLLGAQLRDGLDNLLGTVREATLEPESGKLGFYVVELEDTQELTLVPLGVTNVPKEILDSGAEISLVLLTENEKLRNAPRFESLEAATNGSALGQARDYWQ